MASQHPSRASGPANDTTDLAGFANILLKRWRGIAIATLVGMALALAYLAKATPVYTSSTSLFIDPRARSVVPEEVADKNNLASDQVLVESQLEIITSDEVLRRAVKAEHLDEDPEFAPQTSPGLLSRIKAILIPRPQPADAETRAVLALAESIKVKRAQKTYVVDVEVSSSSPVKATRLTRAVVDAYLKDQAAAKAEEARRANKLIDSRLGELRTQLRQAEIRIDEFKKANNIFSSQGGLVTEQELTRLNAELVTARAVAAEAKGRLELVVQALKNGGSPEYLPDAIRSALVQKLREQYAQVARREAALATQLQSRHPVLIEARSQLAEIRHQINAELKRVSTSARSEYQIAANRVDELLRTLEGSKREVGRANTAQIRLRELEQDAATSRDLLNTFLTRAKQTQEQQNLAVAEARVISPASVPTRPSKPLTWLILALGMVGGMGLGLSRAILLDHLETARRAGSSPRIDGLPVVGSVPSLAEQGPLQRLFNLGRPPQLISFSDIMLALSGASDAPGAKAYLSAIRRLAGRLRGLLQSQRPAVVMLASPLHESGTSSLALAVAYVCAQSGERVLLVDASSTNADLSASLAGDIDARGVIVLDNKAHLNAITRRDAKTGLAFLPIALAELRTLRPHQRKRLASGLSALAQSYDLVVIDGGAMLEDSSAAALLAIADQVVLVAPEDELGSEELLDTIDLVRGTDAHFAGVAVMARSAS